MHCTKYIGRRLVVIAVLLCYKEAACTTIIYPHCGRTCSGHGPMNLHHKSAEPQWSCRDLESQHPQALVTQCLLSCGCRTVQLGRL